jgi:hypothetical protein
MEVIQKQEIINQAVMIKDLDCAKLAQLARFSNEEIEFVKLFWEPTFNKSWIYLTKEMVVDWMGYKDNEKTMRDFYKKLIKDYEENVDYKEVTQNNEIVRKSHSGNFRNEKILQKDDETIQNLYRGNFPGKENKAKSTRGASLKKFYIITGECLKCLLMSAQTPKGKLVRKIYIKTENLVVLMIEVIQEQKLIEFQKQLQIKNDEFKQLSQENKWLHLSTKEKVTFAKYNNKRYGLYTGNSQFELQNFLLKIGKSIRPIKREKDLSASNAPLNNFKMLNKHLIHEGLETRTEKYIHALLTPFGTKENNKTSQEHYMVHPKFANLVIETVLESQNKIVNFINQYIDILEKNNYDFEIMQDILDADNILELLEQDYITAIETEKNKEDVEEKENTSASSATDEGEVYEAEVPYPQKEIDEETNGFFKKKMQKRNDFINRMNNMEFEVISEYDTIEHPVTLLCKEFHEFTIIPNNHDMDKIACYECKRIKKTSDVTESLKERNIICIDYDEKKYKCAKGHEFITSNNNYLLYRNGGCTVCNKRVRLTKEDYHNLAAANAGKWIEKENPSSHFPVDWICAKGHSFSSKYQQAFKYWHTQCKKCHNPTKSYIERILGEIKKYPSAELLDNEILSYDSRVNFKCSHIPNGWNVVLRGFLTKRSWKCSKCKGEMVLN